MGIFRFITFRILKGSVAIITVYFTCKTIQNYRKKSLSRAKVIRKQEEAFKNQERLKKNVEAYQNSFVNDKFPDSIVNLEISILLQKLQDGSFSCLEVLRAYQAKALQITKEFNCVTEFILEAEEWAKQLDADANYGKPKGPLHGLPFSVKDNIDIAGYDSTIGISKFLYQPSIEDAALVKALKQLGAIPFCKTNVPQTNLSFGCSNPIWGLTKNPFDKLRTPGGSTGGEACIIAAGGSPLGIGSDIGGSIRLPAAFCGIFSIKPTSLRLSLKGFKKLTVPNVGIVPVPGIMARDHQTIITVTKLLLDKNHLKVHGDPDVLPIPWNEQMFNQSARLRIGFYEDDGYFPTTPGIRRAVQIAKSRLEAQGHQLVPFVPPRLDYVMNSFVSLLSADRSKYLLETLLFEDIDPLLDPTILSARIPNFVKRCIRPLLSKIAPRLVPVFTGIGGPRVRETHQLWKEILEKNLYKEEFLAYWRDELELDLCIGPCFASPAPLSKDVGSLVPALSYTVLYNFLDFPVGIVPVTKENLEDQSRLDSDYSYNDLVCKLVKANAKGAIGMPLCLQVVGLPYQEELVLRGVNILGSALQD